MCVKDIVIDAVMQPGMLNEAKRKTLQVREIRAIAGPRDPDPGFGYGFGKTGSREFG